jgi:hypothetical protein
MSAGEAELQEPRITFLATLPEVMRHIERLRIKNIIPGVVKRSHDWLDKDSSGNHVFTDLETNGEETLLFACAAFRGLIVNFIEFRGPAVDVAGNALSGFEGNGLRLARRIGALYI